MIFFCAFAASRCRRHRRRRRRCFAIRSFARRVCATSPGFFSRVPGLIKITFFRSVCAHERCVRHTRLSFKGSPARALRRSGDSTDFAADATHSHTHARNTRIQIPCIRALRMCAQCVPFNPFHLKGMFKCRRNCGRECTRYNLCCCRGRARKIQRDRERDNIFGVKHTLLLN